MIPILLLDGLLTTSVSVALVPELTPVKLTDCSCSVDDFAAVDDFVDDFAGAPTRPETHTATATATAMIIMTMTTTFDIPLLFNLFADLIRATTSQNYLINI
jgi:hypothetical protein